MWVDVEEDDRYPDKENLQVSECSPWHNTYFNKVFSLDVSL